MGVVYLIHFDEPFQHARHYLGYTKNLDTRLAAHRAGIRRIILPSRNEADVDEIPEDVKKELQIIFVSGIAEVIDAALEVLVSNPPPSPALLDSARAHRPDPEPQPLTVKG